MCMAMHSYYRLGFGKVPTERTKQAQATIRHCHANFGKINAGEYVHDGPFDVSACALQLLRLPTYPGKKGTEQPPIFRPMATVAKRLPISATAEH